MKFHNHAIRHRADRMLFAPNVMVLVPVLVSKTISVIRIAVVDQNVSRTMIVHVIVHV